MPRKTPTQNSRLEIKLAMETAKLAQLKKDLPADMRKPAAPFVRLKDLRPPTPEERERFYARLRQQVETLYAQQAQEKHDWYMSMAHHAP